MRASFIYVLIVPLLLSAGTALHAQDTPLDRYIQMGLDSNLVLQQKDISLQQAVSALREAKGLFLPKVQLNAGYTSGYGGRSIDFPIGDLLNPVYTTLNQMTQSNSFPQVENVEQNFFPKNFYDVKLHTTVPIWNAPIQQNREIKIQQVQLQQFEADIYKRELVRSIQVAYFHYCQALSGVQIYGEAIGLAKEAERVNQRLLDNGQGLHAYVIRAHSEVEQLEAQRFDAELQSDAAARYFNFLLNRDRYAPIDTTGALAVLATLEVPENFDGVENREEIKALQQAYRLNAQVLKLNRSQQQPTLGGFVDLGMQAENFRVDEKAPYILFGLQLDVPIFSGFSNTEKINRANFDLQNADLQLDIARQQLELQAMQNADALSRAIRNHQAAQARYKAASSYQQLIDRAFREGKSSFIETIEAQNQYILAAEQLNITAFGIRIAAAELEYALAQAPIH